VAAPSIKLTVAVHGFTSNSLGWLQDSEGAHCTDNSRQNLARVEKN
jgi:hypothetical protein